MKTDKKPKILAISSPGGHWIQLNKICNPMENEFEVIYVTPGAQYASAQTGKTVFNISDASATSKHMLIPLTLQLLWIFARVRPAAIVSTGAAPGVIAFLLAKFLPIKTIWVDSIANVSILSRSARMIKKHADLVMTQWQTLSDGKQVIYKGSIL